MRRGVFILVGLLCAVYLFGTNAHAFSGRERIIIEEADKFFNISPREKPRGIENTALQDRLEKKDPKVFILDVRAGKDYQEKRIDGAGGAGMVNIPFKDVFKEANLKRLPRDKEIMVLCYTGGISNQMVSLLEILGYRALAVKGGIEEWDLQGLPLKKGGK